MQIRSLPGLIRQLIRDSGGGVLVYTAIVLPVLLGASGMAVDVATWHLHKRSLQSATDSAAIAGALELIRTGADAVESAAEREAIVNGYKSNGPDVLTVNNPPVSGLRAGSGDSVEVIISRPVPTFFTHYFLGGPVTIVARATAMGDVSDTCVWSLDPSVSGAVSVSGSSQVTFECGMFVNSKNSSGLTQSGESCLTATKIKAAGGYSTAGCLNPTPMTNVPPIVDPLAWMQPPTYDSSCTQNNKVKVNAGETRTLSPGNYCGGIEVSGGGTLNLNPGLYVIRGFSVAGNGTVNGTDVNFYIPTNAGQGQNIDIKSGAIVSLSADPWGDMPGVLFYHDRDGSNVNHNIAGGSSMTLEGIIYFPNQHLSFSGGSSLDASASMLIAKTVSFSGNTNIGGFKGSAVAANPALVTAALIE